MKRVRTRFAPSPTGYMHVGNLRSAIFGYLVAKHYDGDFLLRIEDTDQTRQVEGAVEFIYNTCNLCGLVPDEGPMNSGNYGPYTQSERLPIYKKYAEQLVEMGQAYYCFCDEERLDEIRKIADSNKIAFLYDGHCKKLTKEEIDEKIANGEKYVIRQKMPKEGLSIYHDVVYGEMTFENKLLEDQILLKSDNFPTYNFANVVDDHLMEISHVIRGNEYLTSTPKYNHLYDAFGWEKPVYIHLPMVVDFDMKKLSKRHGASSFMDLYDSGYLPAAVVNYLSLLGWSPETTDEIFSLEELIKIFDPARINKSPAVYDVKKLNWVNAHYIKKLELDELLKITVPHLKEAYDLSDKTDEWVNHLVKIYHNHISYGKEIIEVTDLFFKKDISLDDECKEFMKDETAKEVVSTFAKHIKKINDWNMDNIVSAINNTKEELSVKGKMLYMPIRIMVSGQMHGPELPDTIYLLGKETVINRLNN
ncbi:MAG: glutamate--tRNA ligase [Bacilli bacterium]|nr:glutamate--tRNA ligase [Bacilli bacterium]MDD4283022.1 glutamate--tRNA ligase [Bacilli bacterium]MDD4718829.1 glutamate--tRNA ligase [Bacilli bacterium]